MNNDNRIAIIGYSFSGPGASNAHELWRTLEAKKTGYRQSTKEEQKNNLPKEIYQDSQFIDVGAGLEDYKTFDAKFFGISPRDANWLDPQIRKSLEHAWMAFEHAGYSPNNIEELVGTFLSSSLNSYFLENLINDYVQGDESTRSQLVFLNEPDFLASRIAYHFNWKGPAFTLRAGCSSSSVAIHQACNALNHFDCDIALSGGVAIKPRYHYGYIHEKDGILSADGYCCPFSDNATGTIFANGIAFVVLKRLEDAIENNDSIHGVIYGSAINNDGHEKAGFMAPSPTGQVDAMLTALIAAGLEPDDISNIETHGTGTAIGDPIEFKGLMDVYGKCAKQTISLGAIKANIGHLDAASGATGLIKMLLALKNKKIAPMANFANANNKIDLENSPFYVPTTVQPWYAKGKGRIGVVSSFGIGGTNAQLVVGELTSKPHYAKHANKQEKVFIPLSAKTKQSLISLIQKLSVYCKENLETNVADLSYTLVLGRTHLKCRIGYIVSDVNELISQFDSTQESDLIDIEPNTAIQVRKSDFIDPHIMFESWISGASVSNLNETIPGYNRLSLPGYQFDKSVFWAELTDSQKIQDTSKWFYLPCFVLEKIPERDIDLNNKNVLLFADNHGFVDSFSKILRRKNANVKVVRQSNKYGLIGNEDILLNPSDHSEYEQLQADLLKEDFFPEYIFHAWTLGEQLLNFEQSQHHGLYSLINTIQNLYHSNGASSCKLTIITDKLFNFSGCDQIDPNKSTLLGISQVLPKEHSNWQTNLIDIQILDTKHSTNFQGILNEVARNISSEIVLRGRNRYIRDYQQYILSPDKLQKCSIEKNKNYLVLGGLGNFGLELAEFIGSTKNGRIFLSSRTNFPNPEEWNSWISTHGESHSISQKISYLQDLIKRGVFVEVVKADVTQIEDLQHIKSYIETKHGPVSGVIHAAGVVDNGMIQHKNIDSLQKVFAAKVQGTKNVCKVFGGNELDFIVLCSSMNSIIGGLGQLDNTAANAFIDSYADYYLHTFNENILAINWGAVNEARARNYTATPQFTELSKEHIKNKMTKSEIFDVYEKLFSASLEPRVVVSTLDFEQVIKNWSKVGSLSELLQVVDTTKKDREKLALGDYIEPKSKVAQDIATLWQEYLGLDAIGLKDNFFELGGNSLVAIQFIGKLTKHYQINIHAMSIYEYQTLDEFANYAEQLINEAQEKRELLD